MPKVLNTVAALTAALAAAAAHAGPDVIVGDLYQVSNYGGSAGKHAYAVGTISCNLGDTPLTWVDCSSGPNSGAPAAENYCARWNPNQRAPE